MTQRTMLTAALYSQGHREGQQKAQRRCSGQGIQSSKKQSQKSEQTWIRGDTGTSQSGLFQPLFFEMSTVMWKLLEHARAYQEPENHAEKHARSLVKRRVRLRPQVACPS